MCGSVSYGERRITKRRMREYAICLSLTTAEKETKEGDGKRNDEERRERRTKFLFCFPMSVFVMFG